VLYNCDGRAQDEGHKTSVIAADLLATAHGGGAGAHALRSGPESRWTRAAKNEAPAVTFRRGPLLRFAPDSGARQ
jgi:hypothetical protein